MKRSLFTLTLLAATALAGCGRSESVDSFKPDRAEEKVAVAEPKDAARPAADAKADGIAETAIAPKDECASDPAFVAYRTKLAAAVKAKNFEALKPLVDPQIKLDFGGGGGLDLLGERLAKGVEGALPTRPHWDELAEIMTLGCALDDAGKAATMPYAFARLGGRDGFETMIPRRDGITLYKTADAKGEAVKTLHWEPLTMTGPANAKDDFVAVKLDDGTTGFVRRADARPALDYRALFNKDEDGSWKMTAFIAGD